MIDSKIVDIVVAAIILLISGSDFYKGFLMVFRDKYPLLFMAKVGFSLINLLPLPVREDRYQKAMAVYMRRRKLYGVYALLGGFFGLLISTLLFLSAFQATFFWSMQWTRPPAAQWPRPGRIIRPGVQCALGVRSTMDWKTTWVRPVSWPMPAERSRGKIGSIPMGRPGSPPEQCTQISYSPVNARSLVWGYITMGHGSIHPSWGGSSVRTRLCRGQPIHRLGIGTRTSLGIRWNI